MASVQQGMSQVRISDGLLIKGIKYSHQLLAQIFVLKPHKINLSISLQFSFRYFSRDFLGGGGGGGGGASARLLIMRCLSWKSVSDFIFLLFSYTFLTGPMQLLCKVSKKVSLSLLLGQMCSTLKTTVPLVSYIRSSLRFWYYASLSTCCQNL